MNGIYKGKVMLFGEKTLLKMVYDLLRKSKDNLRHYPEKALELWSDKLTKK